MELLIGLACLAVFLAVVAVVGHGLWVLAAAMFQELSGGSRQPGGQRICRSCGHPHSLESARCPLCGAPAWVPTAAAGIGDLEATVRQLERLRSRGAISAEQHDWLQGLLREERSRLTGQAAVAAQVVEQERAGAAAEASRSPEQRPEPATAAAEGGGLHPLERPACPVAQRPVSSRRPLADLLQAFMEEKNIRWGELVSGLLIIGSAVGLVISLRATLAEAIPYFPALIFMLITAAIHGAGIYTLRRWELRSTSRGVLIIGMLLVPLNFAAAVVLSGQTGQALAVNDPRYLLAVAMGLIAFGTMTYFSSRALLVEGWWRLVVAVLGASASQLILYRQAHAEMSAAWAAAMLALPLSCYVTAVAGQLWQRRSWKRLSARRAEQVLLTLGLASFALLVSLGLLLSKSGAPAVRLGQLAPLLSLAAALILATGLLVHQRARSLALAPARLAGTSLALLGGLLMLAMVVFAWPQPGLLIAVGLVNCALLVCLAVVGQLPALHTTAVACLALAYLVGFHGLQQNFLGYEDRLGQRLWQVLWTGSSSVALTSLVVLAGGVAWGLRRCGRVQEGAGYLAGSAALGAVSIAIALYVGFAPGPQSELATPLLAWYALGTLVAGCVLHLPVAEATRRARRAAFTGDADSRDDEPSGPLGGISELLDAIPGAVTWLGSALLLAALLHGLAWNEPLRQFLTTRGWAPDRPVLMATLLHANLAILTAAAAAVVVIRLRAAGTVGARSTIWLGFVAPLTFSALVSSAAAAPFAVAVQQQQFLAHAGYAGAVALVWLVVAVIDPRPLARAAFQTMATVVVVFLVTSFCQRQDWWTGWPVDPRYLQMQLAVLAGYTLLWLMVQRWLEPAGRSAFPSSLSVRAMLGRQLTLPLLLLAVLVVWSVAGIAFHPYGWRPHQQHFGQPLSYVGWALSAVASIWHFRRRWSDVGPHLVGGFAISLGVLLAATVDPWDAGRTWLAYHVLMMSWLVVAALFTTVALVGREPSDVARRGAADPAGQRTRACMRWATLAGGLVVLLAVRGGAEDLSGPWWSVGALLTTVVLAGVLAVRGRSQPYAYASTLLVGLAVTVFWVAAWPQHGPQGLVKLVQWNLVAVVLAAAVWLVAEVGCQQRRDRSFGQGFAGPLVHHTITVAALGLALLMAVGGLWITALDGPGRLNVNNVFSAALALGLLLLLAGSLWDRQASYTMPGLYAWGLLVLGLSVDGFSQRYGLQGHEILLAVGLVVACYVALTGLIWQQGVWWAKWGSRWGVADPVGGLGRVARWLPAVSLGWLPLVLAVGLWGVLTFELRAYRVTAGFLPVLLAVGLAAMAQQQRRGPWQYLSLLLTGLAAVLLAWADMQPSWSPVSQLTRAVHLLIVLSALTFAFGLVLPRWMRPGNDWYVSVRRVANTWAGAALAVLLLVLLLEAVFFQPGVGAPLSGQQIVAVAVLLVALMAALLSMAVLPGRDPWSLSEQGRMRYVYAAQAVAALLFAHVYLSHPALFADRLRPYWPYLVMAIAFAGVGLGELFQRWKLRVLAEPFQRTGALLPLLPVLGVWVIAAEKIDYTVLLFVVGVLYVLLSVTRQSYVSGLAAAVAGNAALWSLLTDTGLHLWGHPQFWLIPPAVSVLVATQINRGRLSESQLTASRYGCVLVIYLSSTSEMFLRGVGQSLWPPMVLAMLALAGMLLGIVLQIRAFLYLGASFVLLSVVSMVWHASQAIGHIWPWWAFGIALGLAILTLFGIFERKRAQIGLWIDQLRRWEP